MGKMILVLEGHDGAGKTTLARRLSSVIGGMYVRPFAGSNGDRLDELATCDPQGVIPFALQTLTTAVEVAGSELLVFDRHWLTVYSRLPRQLWPEWRRLVTTPPTAVCWADLRTTLTRLEARGERPLSPCKHARDIEMCYQVAEDHGCLILRTDRETEQESLNRLVIWSAQHTSAR